MIKSEKAFIYADIELSCRTILAFLNCSAEENAQREINVLTDKLESCIASYPKECLNVMIHLEQCVLHFLGTLQILRSIESELESRSL